MKERIFKTESQAVDYLLEVRDEIVALPADWDREDFFGMYVCHDARVMWFAEMTEEAVSTLSDGSIDQLSDVGRTLCEYLDGLDHLLFLALVRPAGEHSGVNAWAWRLNSIAMVGKLNLDIREKWLARSIA